MRCASSKENYRREGRPTSTGKLVDVTYIASTPEQVWDALVNGDVTRKYWKHENVSDWKPGSKWEHISADGARTVKVAGKVVEGVPGKRLVLTWADADDRANDS